MNWKTIFGFSWIKLIITVIILIVAYHFKFFGVTIGGPQPPEAFIFPTILIIASIYLIIIIVFGIYSKLKK